MNLTFEGVSERGILRLTGVARNTIRKLYREAGCEAAKILRELPAVECNTIEIDEIWSFVQKRQRWKLRGEDLGDKGNHYVFIALDAETKYVPYHMVGKRTDEDTFAFLSLLRDRVHGEEFQITTDGFNIYEKHMEHIFPECSYAVAVKNYSRKDPRKIESIDVRRIYGKPTVDVITINRVERLNLTVRSQLARFARGTTAFSKSAESHRAVCALFFYWYNLMRHHGAIKATPAMAAGVTDEPYTWEFLLERMRNSYYENKTHAKAKKSF